MSTPFLGQIQIFSFSFAPRGWATCDGQLLPIAQNQALFSLLGTTYGGNGTTNFALPDLRGRVPIHWGNGFNGNTTLGERAGVEAVTLLVGQLPPHNHFAIASNQAPSVGSPQGNDWAASGPATYAAVANSAMSPLANTGGTQPHSNMQPSLVLNICIALQGIFPSRN